MIAQAQSKLTLLAGPRRAATIAGIVATMLLTVGMVGRRAWGRTPVSGKLTLIFTNAAMGAGGYGGSNCDSNTCSGQCLSGARTCYVSGIVPVKIIESVAGRPTKSAVGATVAGASVRPHAFSRARRSAAAMRSGRFIDHGRRNPAPRSR